MSTSEFTALVADIGGTNTRLALTRGTTLIENSIDRYRNDDYATLADALTAYLDKHPSYSIDAACIDIAGPVQDGIGRLTNRDWEMSEAQLLQITGARTVAILNDLQAQAHALAHLPKTSSRLLVQGSKSEGAKLVIGVGTGFNAAMAVPTNHGTVVPPSESGHISLPIRRDEDLSLANFLEQHHGYPSVEEVLSGRGLEYVYEWLSNRESKLSADAIMKARAEGSDLIANKAVEKFIQMMGQVAGNLALIQLPFGGIYLIGGVARAMTPYLDESGFVTAFKDKGRFSEFMGQFSISLVDDDYAALIGCASHLSDKIS